MQQTEPFRALRTLVSSDGGRRVIIYARDDGLFQFTADRLEHEEAAPWAPALSYWSPIYESGLYENAGAAECEARARYDWLREPQLPTSHAGECTGEARD